MAAVHYHVGQNTPGYSPDNDVEVVSSKRLAARLVADAARQYREQEWDLPASQRRRGHGSGEAGYIFFTRPNDVYDLGLQFWWSACDGADCGAEEEED